MRLFTLVLAGVLIAPVAQAKCFGFKDLDVKVCVDGDDSNARKKAAEVCEDQTGKDCKISGYSGECRKSSSLTCYDEDGNEQKYIKAD